MLELRSLRGRKGEREGGIRAEKVVRLPGRGERSSPGLDELRAGLPELWAMGETKVIYHLDEQETPYLVKLAVPAERVTLSELRAALNKPHHKFFFKSMDDDFG